MRAVGMTRLQQDALNRHLAAGRYSWLGMFMNGLVSGLCESFQGKTLFYESAGTVAFTQGGVNGTNIYYVWGSNQTLAIRGSVTSAITGTGIPDAASSTERGLLVLTPATTTAGAAAMSMDQNSVLWIPTTCSFQNSWDIQSIAGYSQASGVSFVDLGVMGDQATAANITDSSKEPADGNPFLAVRIYSGKGRIRLRRGTGAAVSAILESEVFEIPSSAFNLRMEYEYFGTNGNTTVWVNDNRVASLSGVITGPLQVFARSCHGASYASATYTANALKIDAVACTVPLAFGE